MGGRSWFGGRNFDMPVYEYEAQDEAGAAVRGTAFGSTLDGVARDLKDRGLAIQRIRLIENLGDPIPQDFALPPQADAEFLVSVPNYEPLPAGASAHEAISHARPDFQPVHEPAAPPRTAFETQIAGPLVGKISLSHLMFFFRQAATLMDAGIGPAQAMRTLAGQTQSPKLSAIISELREHAEAGRPLSFGMQRHPEQFSPLMLGIVKAGEQGGFLDGAFAQVADHIEQEIQLRNLIRRVTFFPKLVLIASCLIIWGANGIIASVRPGSPFGISSPLTTLAVWLILGPLLVALFLFSRIGLANPRIKYAWDQMLLSLPGLGKIVMQFAMAKFGHAFGALYRAGVPIQQSLTMAADASGNERLRSLMYPAAKRLESGKGITEVFQQTGAFSPIVLDMTATGEASGRLDLMMSKVSEYYEEEAKTRAYQAGTIFGVGVLLCVAIYIAYVVISFYMGYGSTIMGGAAE